MRALMAYRVVSLVLVGVLGGALGACGKEIGDSCQTAADCDPNGTRECDPDPSSPGGYCTIFGCDYSTCPDSSACIRFFTGSFETPPGLSCNADDPAKRVTCTLDELCSIVGKCVPRSSEIRYCMRTCGSNGDCRDGYECRDFDKMIAHGGEPVLAPGVPVDAAHAPKFCARTPGS
jgi:hypothetical protein